MAIIIQSLSITNQQDLFSLFETSHYEHAKTWKTCYCQYYQNTCDFSTWMQRSGETNKDEAIAAIAKGEMQGFLAYENEICVGWLNANSMTSFKRLKDIIPFELWNEETALTICYVIKEEYRGQKVASQLLDHAIRFFRQRGFHQMLALPVEASVFEKMYRGSKQMYLHRGYIEINQIENSSVLLFTL